MEKVQTLVKTIAFILIVLLVGWFLKDYTNMAKDVSERRAEVLLLQSNVNATKTAHAESEKENLNLRNQYNSTQKDLLDWRGKYDALAKNATAYKNRIRRLEADNEDIRTFFDIHVPCSVWVEIFPDSRKCIDYRQNGTTRTNTDVPGRNP